jgi:hypothetical protein
MRVNQEKISYLKGGNQNIVTLEESEIEYIMKAESDNFGILHGYMEYSI